MVGEDREKEGKPLTHDCSSCFTGARSSATDATISYGSPVTGWFRSVLGHVWTWGTVMA